MNIEDEANIEYILNEAKRHLKELTKTKPNEELTDLYQKVLKRRYMYLIRHLDDYMKRN